MAYKTSSGDRKFGDIINEDDADTKIDFGSDTIDLEVGGNSRLTVQNLITFGGGMQARARTVTGNTNAVDDTDCVFLCDTSGGTVKIQLQAATAGRIIVVIDSAANANTNNITIQRNGSEYINFANSDYVIAGAKTGLILMGTGVANAHWAIVGKFEPPP